MQNGDEFPLEGRGQQARSRVGMFRQASALGLAVAAVSAWMAPVAVAQQTAPEPAAKESTGFGEVVVTAQRREENLQDVPIAVTALTADAITRSDISSIDKLTGQVPALIVAVGADRTNVAVRGIGSNITNIAAEGGVAINVDGVYMTRTTLTGATYADLAQIDVLRGPQGTLYGRNATGGAVNISTRLPDGTFNGDVSALAGNGGRYRARGAFGIPIAGDMLSARIALDYETLDGYRYNETLRRDADPEDHISGRGVLRWRPDDSLDIILRASISSDDTSGPIIQYGRPVAGPFNPIAQGGQTAINPTRVRLDTPGTADFDDDIYSATVSYDFGGVVLKSITAYQNHDLKLIYDADGTSLLYANVDFDENSSAWTQEVTLSGGGQRLDWLVGGWYMDDDARALMRFRLPGVGRPPFSFDYTQKTKATAIFGQATYALTDHLRATVGIRYSEEEKTLVQILPGPACPGSKTKYTNTSPKFGLDYRVNDSILLYATATRGFKAGGGNVSVCGNVYGPETLWSYESGVKSQWFDNRLRANVNGYYYDYAGYQASQITNSIPPTAVIRNAASATVYGLEAELGIEPTEGLVLTLNAAWADSEFGQFLSAAQFGGPSVNVTGNEVPLIPKFSGNASVQYEVPVGDGKAQFSFQHNWSSSFFFDVFNQPFTRQSSYGRSNARVSYAFGPGALDGLEVAAFVNNLEDKDILNRADGSGVFGGTRLGYDRPRTYGAEVRRRF